MKHAVCQQISRIFTIFLFFHDCSVKDRTKGNASPLHGLRMILFQFRPLYRMRQADAFSRSDPARLENIEHLFGDEANIFLDIIKEFKHYDNDRYSDDIQIGIVKGNTVTSLN